MEAIIWHFLIGMVVSFIGSIPLGSVNLSVLQTTLDRGIKAGLIFALGATIVELVYSYIAIKFSAYLLANRDVELYIQLVAIPTFVILSLYSFNKKSRPADKPKVAGNKKSNFFKGVLIGLVNPLQIPFWVAYGTYMLSNNWIKNDSALLNFFVLGIICGTSLLLTLVVLGGNKLDKQFNLTRYNMDKAIGILFMGLAVFQTVKLVF